MSVYSETEKRFLEELKPCIIPHDLDACVGGGVEKAAQEDNHKKNIKQKVYYKQCMHSLRNVELVTWG